MSFRVRKNKKDICFGILSNIKRDGGKYILPKLDAKRMLVLQLVYDKDTFSTDDFMGSAEVDIQPLLSAAKASEDSSVSEPMQLGNWKASKEENTLVKDGVITLEDGKVKQEIAIKLQNVERGVLEIELECVPLTQ